MMSVHRTHGLVVSPGFRILNTLHRWPATSGSRSAILWVLPFEKPQGALAGVSFMLFLPFAVGKVFLFTFWNRAGTFRHSCVIDLAALGCPAFGWCLPNFSLRCR